MISLDFRKICSGVYNAAQDTKTHGRVIYSIQNVSYREEFKRTPWMLSVKRKNSYEIERMCAKTKKELVEYSNECVAPYIDSMCC